jgi:hypothetical protein
MVKKLFGRQSGAFYFDLFIALFIFTLIWASFGLTPRSARLPMLIGVTTLGLIALDALLMARSARRETEAQDRPKRRRASLDKALMKKIVVALGFMCGTVALWELVGFVPASIIVTVGFGLFLGARNKITLALASILLTTTLYAIFGFFLGVPLPRGVLLDVF